MSKVNQLKNKARREEQRENWSRAIELYSQALDASRSKGEAFADLSLYNRIGDIYLRIGQKNTAVRYYEQAIDRYAEQDLHTSAIALCNKVLRILPERSTVYLQLGRLQLATNLIADARAHYHKYALAMRERGGGAAAFDAIEELIQETGDPQTLSRWVAWLSEEDEEDAAAARVENLRDALAVHGIDADHVLEKVRSGDVTGLEIDQTAVAERDPLASAFLSMTDDALPKTAGEPPARERDGTSSSAVAAGAAETDRPADEAPPLDVEPAATSSEPDPRMEEDPIESWVPALEREDAELLEPELASDPWADESDEPWTPEPAVAPDEDFAAVDPEAEDGETDGEIPVVSEPGWAPSASELSEGIQLEELEESDPGFTVPTVFEMSELEPIVSPRPRSRASGLEAAEGEDADGFELAAEAPGPETYELEAEPSPAAVEHGGPPREGVETYPDEPAPAPRGRTPRTDDFEPAAAIDAVGTAHGFDREPPLGDVAWAEHEPVTPPGGDEPPEGATDASWADDGTRTRETEEAELEPSAPRRLRIDGPPLELEAASAGSVEAAEGPSLEGDEPRIESSDDWVPEARATLDRTRAEDEPAEDESAVAPAAPASDAPATGDPTGPSRETAEIAPDPVTPAEAPDAAAQAPAGPEAAATGRTAATTDVPDAANSEWLEAETLAIEVPPGPFVSDLPPDGAPDLDQGSEATEFSAAEVVPEPAAEPIAEPRGELVAEAAADPPLEVPEPEGSVASATVPELPGRAGPAEASRPTGELAPEPEAGEAESERLAAAEAAPDQTKSKKKKKKMNFGRAILGGRDLDTGVPLAEPRLVAPREDPEEAFRDWVASASLGVLRRALPELEGRAEREKALLVIERLSQLEEHDVEFKKKHVDLLEQLGRTDEAVEACGTLAAALEHLGRPIEARDAFARLLGMAPGDERAQEAVERLADAVQPTPDPRHESEPAAAPPRAKPYAPAHVTVHEATMITTHVRPANGGVANGAPTPGPHGAPQPYSGVAGGAEASSDFEQLLSEYRAELHEKPNRSDSMSRTELGANLKEMGRLDDAIRELQAAVREPSPPPLAFELLGEAFLEKGQSRIAVRLLEKALATLNQTDREMLGVLYQLGVTYEQLDDPTKALLCYERIFSVDIDYRDVQDRILSCST